VYLVHEAADGRRRVLASDVETADSVTRQVLGLMGRSSVPADYALVFRELSDPVAAAIEGLPWPLSALADDDHHGVHMLFVRTPLDVLWVADGEVTQVETLAPWTGTGNARADTLVELAGGGAAGVEPGDRVFLVDSLANGALRDWRSGGWRDRHRRGRR
jgi:uncharacterized membrane protein (UPF0127 family)